MVFKHEIPADSRLYFGEVAKLKRKIEQIASQFLTQKGFEEILTPNFSYIEHQGLKESKELIKINDSENKTIVLRADSTLDVVRIINKRLGRATEHKKWFYIQPVFKYPTTEFNQIGIEWIENSNLEDILKILIELIDSLDIDFDPTLQISNSKIPKLIAKELNLDIDYFENKDIERLLSIDSTWLKSLIYLQSTDDLKEATQIVPDSIREELLKIEKVSENLEYKNLIISPLYYSKRSYYDGVLFKLISDNYPIAMGGSYIDDDILSVGFSIYSDNLLEQMIKRNSDV